MPDNIVPFPGDDLKSTTFRFICGSFVTIAEGENKPLTVEKCIYLLETSKHEILNSALRTDL